MNKQLMQRVVQRLRNLKPPKATARFMAHNRIQFKPQEVRKDAPVVLMEFNEMHSSQIAYSYLANALARPAGAHIVAYLPLTLSNWRERLSFFFSSRLGTGAFGVYASFGVVEFITISLNTKQKKRAASMLTKVLAKLKNKTALEELAINGVWIGDLVYDTYLMRFRHPTVDLSSNEFREFLLESLESFVFWEDYMGSKQIAGINVSHCVYNMAIPLRLAVLRDIPAFQASLTHVYRLNRQSLFAYSDYKEYPELFAKLSAEVRREGLEEARKRIERRFAGEVGVDMQYSTRSAYEKPRHNQLLQPSLRKKILIATHCFFDSPHSYGNNLFPDFWEWLEFLGKMSNKTNYDWYIKTHPDYLPGTMEIINSFIARYTKFTLLPPDASHHQIIGEGIDVALTVYGTIGFEYAALGKPVINCSVNNPHISYNFNLHPTSVDEYRDLLLSLDDLQLNIDFEKVYEFYFMHHIHNSRNLFLDDYESMETNLGRYSAQFTPAIFDYWLERWSPELHEQLEEALVRFVESQDFRMVKRF